MPGTFITAKLAARASLGNSITWQFDKENSPHGLT